MVTIDESIAAIERAIGAVQQILTLNQQDLQRVLAQTENRRRD